MVNKDKVIGGYEVLYQKLDEMYLDLTVKQLKALKAKLEETWTIIERRKK